MSQQNRNNNVEKKKRPMEGASSSQNTNGNNDKDFIEYPPRMVNDVNVLTSNKNLFIRTLEEFHGQMKTKFMIPIVGGKALDLLKLFKEVTTRGGIEKVITERKWKEVTASFTFPSTATNASYVLRKYYYGLLYHFEKRYYSNCPGYNSAEVEALLSPVVHSSSRRLSRVMLDSLALPLKRKIRDDDLQLPAMPVTGVIDGKTEHGYLITVNIGSHTLRGALFHCSDQPLQPSITLPQSVTFSPSPTSTAAMNIPQFTTASVSPNLGVHKQRRRRKRRLSTMDPNHPKMNRSGYNFFFAEQHALLKPLYHPGKDREISRIIGERWNSLPEAEKEKFRERGRVDKQRYQRELALYKGKQEIEPSPVISDAVPINQRPASSHDFTVEGVDSKVDDGDMVLTNNSDPGSDYDEIEESDNGNKNQDVVVDAGSISGSGSGSESDASIEAIIPVSVEPQSIHDVGPSQQTGADVFELRKREVMDPVVGVESKAAEDFSNSTEGGVKTSEGYSSLVEAAPKMVEGLNNPVDSDLKASEVTNSPAENCLRPGEASDEGDIEMGEHSNDLVVGDLKTSEGYTTEAQNTVIVVEDPAPADGGGNLGEDTDLVVGDLKTSEGCTIEAQDTNVTVVEDPATSDGGGNLGEDTDNLVESGFKLGEDTDNLVETGFKLGEDTDNLVGDLKTSEGYTIEAQDTVTVLEDPATADGGGNLGEDTDNLVESGFKLGEDTGNLACEDVKMAEAVKDTASGDGKPDDELNRLAVGDVAMVKDVAFNPESDVIVTDEKRDKG